MRPISYRFDAEGLRRFRAEGRLSGAPPLAAVPRQTGFLAQDVARAAHDLGFTFDGVLAPAGPNGYYSLAYSQFVVPLVQAVQEQQTQLETLQLQNTSLQAQVQSQAARLEQQQAALLVLQAQMAQLLGTPASAPK